jgi:aspartyl/asparaginyl-tRNA synthetase
VSDWRPSAPREALELRARLNRTIRDFFESRGVLEVETPVLSARGNTDPNIESFRASFSGHVDAGSRERWLRTVARVPAEASRRGGLSATATSSGACSGTASPGAATTPSSRCWSGTGSAGTTVA